MSFRPRDVRHASIRVALAATGLVGIAYLAVAVAVMVIVTGNLTGQIDSRLTDTLSRGTPRPVGGGGRPFEPPSSGRPELGAPLLIWTIAADGTLTSPTQITDLPTQYRTVSNPITVTLDGFDVRLAGAPAGTDYVIVGQTLESVQRAQSTLILAELVIGPVLLALVFLGAVAVGRRVAAPFEEARRRQMEFTADASHELRTPLSVVEAHTSLALAQDRSADWYRAAFQRVDRESKRMRRLLDDLLWLARFDAAQGTPDAEPVDVGVLVGAAVDRFGVIAEARKLTLAVHAAGPGLVVTAPPEWLDRLLGVLLDNACKYSPEGGTVDVTVAAEAGRVTLSIDDAGPGIPEEARAEIFDRFHRATATGTGAGLGLAIGDEIVRATGGRWRVGSSPAGGARMAVTWRSGLPGGREPGA